MTEPTDGFHPPLRHIRADQVSAETAQSAGMQRYAAISEGLVGSQRLWMGQTHVGPAMRSADHHHGEAETAIYVVSGHPEFVFLDEASGEEVRLRTAPGDMSSCRPTRRTGRRTTTRQEAVVVIARSTQEAIVVNLPSLQG